jgi:hypothetical protein
MQLGSVEQPALAPPARGTDGLDDALFPGNIEGSLRRSRTCSAMNSAGRAYCTTSFTRPSSRDPTSTLICRLSITTSPTL